MNVAEAYRAIEGRWWCSRCAEEIYALDAQSLDPRYPFAVCPNCTRFVICVGSFDVATELAFEIHEREHSRHCPSWCWRATAARIAAEARDIT